MPETVEEKTPILRYRPMSVLGVGGMGRVVKCDDTQLKRTVAVKFLLKDATYTIIQRFQKEAKAAATLDHPNVIKVLDFGKMEDGDLFLAMEYLPGKGLEQLIEEKGAVDLDTSLEIVKQICLGLEHAHKKNIVHRDIKPSNVILTRDHNDEQLVKIVDFGIAGFRDNLDQSITNTGAVVGSPSYISPEAAMAKTVDKRSDVYSLGCLIFELLTGKKPFGGKNVMETLLLQINKEAPSLYEVSNVEFPEKLEAIVKKCLKKEKDDRYQSIDDLRKDIVALQYEFVEAQYLFEEQLDESSSKDDRLEKKSLLVVAVITLGIAGFTGLAFFLLNSSKSTENVSKGKEVKVGEPGVDAFVEIEHEFPKIKIIDKGKTCQFNYEVNDKFLRSEDIPLKRRYNFIESEVEGFGLKYLNRGITVLNFKKTKLNDDGLAEVAKFPALRILYLRRNPEVTTIGIEYLAKSKTLDSLQYQTARFNFDKSIYTALSKLKSLELLMINNDGMVEAGEIEELAKLPKLDKMQFIKSELSKEALEQIGKLPRLYTLAIESSCEVEPGGFEELDNPRLGVLYVGTKITKAELNKLVRMKRLKVLRIANYRELKDDIKKIKKARPKLKIEQAKLF